MNREAKRLSRTGCLLSLILLALAPQAAAQQLELVVRTGHSGHVNSVAYSPDGKLLASGSFDKTIKLWDAGTGQEILTLSGHTGSVKSVTFSPDGKHLASASNDKTIRLWNVEKKETVWTFEGYKYGAKSVAFNSDGSILAMVGDSDIRLFRMDSGKIERSINLLFEFNPYFERLPVAFSPDGRSFAAASLEKKVWVWDIANEGAAKQLGGKGGSNPSGVDAGAAVAFSPKGGVMVSTAGDNTISVWDLNTGLEIKTLGGGKAIYTSLAFSPGGEILAAGTRDKSVVRWETSTWGELTPIEVAGESGAINTVAFSRDGKILATGGKDIQMFDVATGKTLFPPGKNAHTFNPVRLSPDGKTVAARSDDDQSIKLWNLATGQVLQTLKSRQVLRPTMTYSPDGKIIAVGSQIGIINGIELWEVETGKLSATLRDSINSSHSMVFSADGKRLVSEGMDGVTLWDVERRKVLHTIKCISVLIFSQPALSSDARLIAKVCGRNEIVLWNVESGAVPQKIPIPPSSYAQPIVATLLEGPLVFLAFSPDALTLIGAYRADRAGVCEVRVWSVKDGTVLKTIKVQRPVNSSVLFSPDGKTLAFNNDRGDLGLLDLENGVELPSPASMPPWCCRGLALSAPGGQITFSNDGNRVKLFNASTQKEVGSLIALNQEDWAFVSADGRFDTSAGAQGLMHYSYGLENITLEQLKEAYYEPGLLAKLLGNSKDPLRPVVPLLDVKLHPEVIEQVLEPVSAKLFLRLKNRGGGIGQVRVLVNDKLAVEDARDKALRSNPYVPEARLTVDLSRSSYFRGKLCDAKGESCRDNKITVVTSNTLKELGGGGNINSRGAEIVWPVRGKDEYNLPTLYAIVGGVSDYGGAETTALDLRFAAKDAEDFAAALGVGARRLFCPKEKPDCLEKVHIKLLSTSGREGTTPPTKENFRKAFEEVAQKARPEDILVVYFAGHGITLGANTDTYLFLTQEARTASREDLARVYKTTAITSGELSEWLTQTEWRPGRKGIDALKQVLILDTCAAGVAGEQLALASKRDLSSDQVRAIEFLKDRAGVHILMGSTADRPSYEAGQYGQGLLTYALLQGLRGAALDKGDFVNVQSLFRYAETQVPQLAGGIGGVQKPVIKSPTGNTFLIGQMTEADKLLLGPLASVKPRMLRPYLGSGDENDDPLNLTTELRKRLDAESSYEVMRRSGRGSPVLIYVDDDSFPSALRVTGKYTVEGETVTITAYLRRDRETIANLPVVRGSKEDVLTKLLDAVRTQLAALRPLLK